MKKLIATMILVCVASVSLAVPVTFTTKPKVKKKGGKVGIGFAVSEKTDVEVAILDANGKVVRHLAGGVVGAEKAASPLKPGLEQVLVWDMKDDFGKAVPEGDYKVRVGQQVIDVHSLEINVR